MNVQKLLDASSRAAFQKRVLRDLDVAETILRKGMVAAGPPCVGVEQELQLVGADGRPADVGDKLAAAFSAPMFQEELSRFSFEVALPPVEAGSGFLGEVDKQIEAGLDRVTAEAARHGARPVLCGILPSLRLEDMGLEALTESPRYELLHELRHDAKSSGFEYQIRGIDELILPNAESLLLDGVFTSLQLHWQVRPERAANEYNWSQLIAAPCLAAACSSPLFLGRRLWHETRISLFQQTSDLRQRRFGTSRDIGPRASLGNGWIDDIIDVWKEEIAFYAPEIGLESNEDSEAELLAGKVPGLAHLQFFNGSVYRWNRLCYGVNDDEKAALRIEARALPAGLTRRDQMANAALWWGLMATADEEAEGLTEALPFSRVRESFNRAARDGMESQIFWKNGQSLPADRLLLDELLPMAERGLGSLGVSDAGEWLQPVEERARSMQTASRWMLDSFDSLRADYDRNRSSLYLTEAMIALGETGEPVSRWPVRKTSMPRPAKAPPLRPGDSIDLALHRLSWERRAALPVGGGEATVGREQLEQARRDGLNTVGEEIERTSGTAPAAIIDAFGHAVELKRVYARKRAERPGPLLVILAGLHGNERNGVAAMVEFLASNVPECGEIVGLLGNLPALEQNTRYLDHDLNRTFAPDGWPEDTPEGREATALWDKLEEIKAEAEERDCWLVDLHGTSGHTPPYLSAMRDRDFWPILDETPVPKSTGFEKEIPNTLVERAGRNGWTAATFELGALAAPVSVTNGVAILCLIADTLGMVPLGDEDRDRIADGLAAQSPTQDSFQFVYRHAIEPEDEFKMLPGFVSFQPLRKGEHVGDDRRGPVLAPCHGRILMPLYQSQGESGFYVVA